MTDDLLFAPEDIPVQGFEQFWKAYPRHTSKADALKVWTKLKPHVRLQATILQAIAQQKQGAQWTAGFIPEAARWLRGKRWEDEVEPVYVPPQATYGGFDCPHTPHCRRPSECIDRSKQERVYGTR